MHVFRMLSSFRAMRGCFGVRVVSDEQELEDIFFHYVVVRTDCFDVPGTYRAWTGGLRTQKCQRVGEWASGTLCRQANVVSDGCCHVEKTRRYLLLGFET